MMRAGLFTLGGALLAAIWLGPLPELARRSFAAHMAMHMGVVAIAAPLLAGAFAAPWPGRVRWSVGAQAAVAASLIEMTVVWGWHAPALHHAARQHTWALALEQGSFLIAGVALWVAVLGGTRDQQRRSAGAGVAALLFTSMHMTLLGALFALSNRPLFQHAPADAAALADQHLGGAIMLLVGGASYLFGGLWLTARMLHPASRTRFGNAGWAGGS